MMITKTLNLLFIAYLLLLLPGTGLVLCWGEEGHLALEASDGDSCCSERQINEPFVFLDNDPCLCLPCWDVQLTFQFNGHLTPSHPEWQKHVLIPVDLLTNIILDPQPLLSENPFNSFDNQFIPASQIHSIRTVQLII